MKTVSFLNPLGFYGFREQRRLNPIEFGGDVDISPNDKIISVTEDGSLLGVVKLSILNNELSLIGKDGNIFSTVELPLVDVIDDAYYDDDTDRLVINVSLTDGNKKQIEVPFNDLLDDYAKAEDVQKNAEDIATVNANLVTAIDNINKNVADGFNTLNAGIKGNELRIEALEKKVEDVSTDSELAKEREERKAMDSKLAATIKTVNDNLITTINNYNTIVLPKLVSDLNQTIMNETNARILADNDLRSSIEQLGTSIDEAKKSINDLSNSLEEQGDRITELENMVSGGVVSDAELAEAIKKEEDRATSVEQELSGKVSNLVSSIDSISSEITNITNEITTINERLDSLESDLSSIPQLTEEIKKVNDRVDKLTSDVQTMVNQINDNINTIVNQLNKNIADGFTTINNSVEGLRIELANEATARQNKDALLEKALANKVDYTTIGEKTREVRKAIVLENHDTLMGKGTDGTIYNLAMVSKWDKADFGSAAIVLNFNGKEERPTYNDSEEIALLKDVTSTVDSIKLTKGEDNVYTLSIGDKVIGTIEIPFDKFIKEVRYVADTNELVITFVTENGESVQRIDLKDLIDTYLAGDGLDLEGSTFFIKLDPTTESFLTVSENGLKLDGVQNAIDTAVSNAIAESESKTDELLANKVDWTDISTEDNPNRKAIVFGNHDTILGTTTSGTTYNVAMINKWDVVDLGTSNLPINLNTPAGVRPTVQEAGQSGEQAHQVSYVSDVQAEIARAMAKEDEIVGKDSDTQDTLSLVGVKKYAENIGNNINVTIETKIEDAVTPIEAQLGNFITKEEAATAHDEVLAEAKEYTDTVVGQATAATITEAVKQANAYTDETIGGISEQLIENSDRIQKVENRCDHYDTLFGMILEEHDSGVTLDYYNKSEVDGLLAEKADKSDIPTELPNPEALTIKYNGVEAFTYDGSKQEVGNFIVNASTVPMSDTDATTIAAKIGEVEAEISDNVHLFDEINLEKQSDLEYALKVGDRIAGTISIPKDQFLKSVSYDSDTKDITFVFELASGEASTVVNVSDLIDTYIASDGLTLSENEFSVLLSPDTQKYIQVAEDGVKIVGVDEALAKKVDLVDISTEDNPNRKAIILENHDVILGKTTDGSANNLIMMSKWNKVDVGTVSNEINLNGSAEHPTYNDEKQLAFVDDIEAANAELKTQIEEVNSKVDAEIERSTSEDNAIREELAKKVEYTPFDENRKTIELDNHDTISGKKTDGGSVNIAMVSKWDKVDLGSATLPINLNGSEERPTYNDDIQLALLSDVETINASLENFATKEELAAETEVRSAKDVELQSNIEAEAETARAAEKENADNIEALTDRVDAMLEAVNVHIPVRTIKDSVYSKEEILGWFGVEVESALKGLINREGQMFIGFNVTYSQLPHDYKMPIQYLAFESNNQIKAVVIGLDTSNDNPVKYEIVMNLDGTIFEGTNSNVKVTMSDLAFKSDIESATPDLTPYAKVEDLNAESGRAKAAEQANAAAIAKANEDLAAEISNRENADTEIKNMFSTIAIEKQSDLVYSLKVGDSVAGTINIPQDQFLKSVSYNAEAKTIDFVFNTESGDLSSSVDVSDLVDTYVAGNGLALNTNEFTIKVNPNTQQYIEVSADGISIVGINEALTKKVDWVDIATEDNPNRKGIVLNNHDTILGYTTNGDAKNLIMMSKWDKVDVGTTANEINLNGSAEHPTYNDEKQLAFVDEVEAVKTSLDNFATKEELNSEVEARSNADVQLQADLEAEATTARAAEKANADAIAEIQEELESTVKFYVDQDNEKVITLDNAELINARSNDDELENKVEVSGRAISLIQLNKWNVVDIGSPYTITNINTPKGERPTVQEQGQSGQEAHKIAYVSDIDALSDKMNSLEESYAIDITNLLSANDSQAISNAIGGIDNLKSAVTNNKVVIGSINNGEVTVSIRNLGNVTTLYYVLDTVAGYTVNEINITNNSGELSKEIRSHSMMTEEMVVDDLTTEEATLPLSANQGKVLNDKVEDLKKTYVVDLSNTEEAKKVHLEILAKYADVTDATPIKDVFIKNNRLVGLSQTSNLIPITGARLKQGSVHFFVDIPVRFQKDDNVANTSFGKVEIYFTEDGTAEVMTSNELIESGGYILNYENGGLLAKATLTMDNGYIRLKGVDDHTISSVNVDNEIANKVMGNLDVQKYIEDNNYSVQVLNKLEESYISDLGTPENINGQPYNAETNNYSIGQPYLTFAKFDESFVFHYDLYALNGTFDMGYMGKVFDAIKLNMDTYDNKLADLEKRITSLEGANA